jgi:glycosyltransferase involved in cell wall biosynthesis
MPINERRAALGLPTNAAVVGLFGRFTAWKGQHVALDAIARVPDAHFVLVGDALFDETDYAQSLRAQARAPGIEERVHFAGFQHGVASWMNTMDVVEHASTQSKPLGLVIVKSMAAGKPVIASNDGTAPGPKADVDVDVDLTLARHR